MVPAALAETDLYKVEGVQVDVTADSALAARDQAFEKAQVDAFTILAGRMLPESELATFKAPEVATISGMVQDYEVTAEKLSSVRYIGTYTISFRGAAVERFFNTAGKSYTNVVSAPMVILPFYQKDGRTYLWSPFNVWMRAWNRSNVSQGVVPLIVPIGDLEDVSDIGDEEVFSYKPEKLAALLRRYDAGEAAIALVTPAPNLANVAEEDFATGKSLNVSLYRTDRGQPEQVQDIAIAAQAGETYARLLDRAVEQVQTSLKQNWKERTAVAAPATPQVPLSNRLTARVKIQSLEEWAKMQSSLNRISAVSGTTLKSLSPREALVDISYRGDENVLRSALAQAGLYLSHPQYAGYSESATENRLIYDLTTGGPAPVQQYQPSNFQPPSQGQIQRQGGYQSPRQDMIDRAQGYQPGGYPLPPRDESGYNGRF